MDSVQERYYLYVDGLIVYVGKGEAIPPPSPAHDESALLAHLKELYKTIGPKPDYKSYKRDTRIDKEPPPNFIRDLVAGKQNVLIQYADSLHVVWPQEHSGTMRVLDLMHMCALGGFVESLKFLLSIGLRAYTGVASYVYGFHALAAAGGYTNMLGSALPDKNENRYSALQQKFIRAAYHFGNPHFIRIAERDFKAAAKAERVKNIYLSDYTPPDIRERLDHEELPSLYEICSHVVAAETLRHTQKLATQLVGLPAKLVDSVVSIIAQNSKGYQTLAYLAEMPELRDLVSTGSWLDSFHSSEQQTRIHTYREFLGDTNNGEQPLIDVFEEYNTFVTEPVDEFEESVTKFFPQPREVGVPSIVNHQQFLKQFKTFTGGFFDHFDFSNTVVIGGSVIGSLLPITTDNAENYYKYESPFKGSDIDIYIYGLSAEDFWKKVQYIYQHTLKFAKCEVHILKSVATVSFMALFPFRTIQIVINEFTSKWQILTGVDIDCSAFAFDGTKLWCSPRARMAVNRRWTVVDQNLYEIRGCPTYELRLIKYARRGFTIVDRLFHTFPKHATIKVPEELDDYLDTNDNFEYVGARLISLVEKHPNLASELDEHANKTATPYGPGVTLDEVSSFLEDFADNSDVGYGPADTCPEFVSNESLQTVELDPEAKCYGLQWYHGVEEK